MPTYVAGVDQASGWSATKCGQDVAEPEEGMGSSLFSSHEVTKLRRMAMVFPPRSLPKKV